jgi:hypothetical protein
MEEHRHPAVLFVLLLYQYSTVTNNATESALMEQRSQCCSLIA